MRTREDWSRRRAELKALIEGYEYGPLPPKPEKMTVKRGETRVDEATRSDRQELESRLDQLESPRLMAATRCSPAAVYLDPELAVTHSVLENESLLGCRVAPRTQFPLPRAQTQAGWPGLQP